jgi:hypothetical protein
VVDLLLLLQPFDILFLILLRVSLGVGVVYSVVSPSRWEWRIQKKSQNQKNRKKKEKKVSNRKTACSRLRRRNSLSRASLFCVSSRRRNNVSLQTFAFSNTQQQQQQQRAHKKHTTRFSAYYCFDSLNNKNGEQR